MRLEQLQENALSRQKKVSASHFGQRVQMCTDSIRRKEGLALMRPAAAA